MHGEGVSAAARAGHPAQARISHDGVLQVNNIEAGLREPAPGSERGPRRCQVTNSAPDRHPIYALVQVTVEVALHGARLPAEVVVVIAHEQRNATAPFRQSICESGRVPQEMVAGQ